MKSYDKLRVALAFVSGFILSKGQTTSCECHDTWAVCRSGWGEHGAKGCGSGSHNERGSSCADQCAPGEEQPWKPLYRHSVAEEARFEAECGADPTAKWGYHQPQSGAPFAIAFAGGMRNFATVWFSWKKLVLEPSGGNVHLYFHVWRGENGLRTSALAIEAQRLAQSLPETKAFVEEDFNEHVKLLHRDEPGYPSAVSNGMNRSWIAYPEAAPNHAHPFVVGATYSQFRKVYLCLRLVMASEHKYSLVLRARPDHIILEKFDLRHFASDFGSRSSVQRARGHFLAIPERAPQIVTDQFAIGTPQAVFAYAQKPLPFTAACCEGYIQRNLDMRCFVRSTSQLEEEFTDPAAVDSAIRQTTPIEGADVPNEWRTLPRELRRSDYSPLILNHHVASRLGNQHCLRLEHEAASPSAVALGDGAGSCIPLFRTRYMYIHRIVTRGWIGKGVVCTGLMGDGKESGGFLVRAGIANGTDAAAGKKFGFPPCLEFSSLRTSGGPWQLTLSHLATLEDGARKEFSDHVG